MVKAQTPTVAEIKNTASETDARALISLAICEVCDFFNVSKNMSDTQIALTADLIIESFWYLKLEEIKYCFRRAMRTAKLFDRLDGNIILGWLRTYDAERTEEAIRISEQEETQAVNRLEHNPGAVKFEEYIEWLRGKANAGDKDATERLHDIENPPPSAMKIYTSQERHERAVDFHRWYYTEYLQTKKIK